MPEPLLERCRRLALPIALTWGMTEAASQVCTRRPGDLDARRDSGAPLLFARVGQRGERLVVRGPIVDDELVSSDLGRVDERGRVQVEARADDAIISGGEKIAPERLERVLCAHPSIREAVVMGRPDARWGQRPVALLVAQGPRAASEALREHCRRSLPAFEVPDAFHYTDTLPKSDLGKVLRSEVKRLLDESLGLEQAEPAHAVEQRRGRRAGDEAVERHESVLGLHARTHLTVLAAQGVLKADRSLAESRDGELDVDAVVHANGPLEVRLGVHQRHANTMRLDERLDATNGRHQHFLVRGVTELEHPREEQDAGAIDFEEARSDSMNERHDDDRR
jgi:hypothetical protein